MVTWRPIQTLLEKKHRTPKEQRGYVDIHTLQLNGLWAKSCHGDYIF